MSQEYCWECGESYARDEVLDIPVFKKGWTIKWCLNCVMKQLQWTDYKLIRNPISAYIPFKIRSIEDDQKEYHLVMDELKLSYESQHRKLKESDNVWDELHSIALEVQYGN